MSKGKLKTAVITSGIIIITALIAVAIISNKLHKEAIIDKNGEYTYVMRVTMNGVTSDFTVKTTDKDFGIVFDVIGMYQYRSEYSGDGIKVEQYELVKEK
jgi:hypothetical protein